MTTPDTILDPKTKAWLLLKYGTLWDALKDRQSLTQAEIDMIRNEIGLDYSDHGF